MLTIITILAFLKASLNAPLTKFIGNKTGYVHTAVYIACLVASVFWITKLSLLEVFVWAVLSNLLVGYFVSGFQHRYCSHKSWQPNRFVEVLTVVLITFFLLTPCMGWAGIHRQHHKHTDTEKDPHGNVHSIFDNFMVFNNVPPVNMVPRWMIRDKLYLLQARWYWEFGILSAAFMFAVGLGGFWASFIAVAYIFQVTLNIFGHLKKEPINVPWLSIFYVGELYHKNHHDNPGKAQFGFFDSPYQFFIRFLDVRKNR